MGTQRWRLGDAVWPKEHQEPQKWGRRSPLEPPEGIKLLCQDSAGPCEAPEGQMAAGCMCVARQRSLTIDTLASHRGAASGSRGSQILVAVAPEGPVATVC